MGKIWKKSKVNGRELHMIDWLIRQMFKIPALRINIFQEVDMYNSISRILADDESSKIACTIWCEEDGWRGWNIKEDGTYYFHDIAEPSLGDIMQLVTSEPEESDPFEQKYGMLTEL